MRAIHVKTLRRRLIFSLFPFQRERIFHSDYRAMFILSLGNEQLILHLFASPPFARINISSARFSSSFRATYRRLVN